LDLVVVLTVFGVVFLGELPDKTAVASLVLGARYPPGWVLAGVWAAFAVHVVIACVAGGFLAALPRRPVELVTAALFLLGAVLLFRSDPEASAEEGEHSVERLSGERRGPAVSAGAFGVVLVAEFGDLTQILTVSLAARYGDPLAVGVGSTLALWVAAGGAIAGGRGLLKIIPMAWLRRGAALVMLVLAAASAVTAIS
jgi:putative Ca2+/H+ antiporter (TMEM165/GDT1 family)